MNILVMKCVRSCGTVGGGCGCRVSNVIRFSWGKNSMVADTT